MDHGHDMLYYERLAYAQGARYVAGIDEVGRGCLAGPVVACAIIFPPHTFIEGVKDSKKLSPEKREYLFDLIQKQALGIGIGIVEESVIDEINILRATIKAMEKAVQALQPCPDHLLIDALFLENFSIPQFAIKEGDNISFSIAAASIVAKVTRDRMMIAYSEQYPQYQFSKHKGYGTPEHLEAIARYGPCPLHRKSFRGVKEYCKELNS
ncbi:MAG TPA: ribonuclease HII [Candidatus Limnocylindrales bacterium]|nr:ribonuclease HII [Candidatus Limnocylindrales bacterium]